MEKGTLDMVPEKLTRSLSEAGFARVKILPFQSIPHFHSKILAGLDRIVLDKIRGKFAMYIIIRGEKI